MIDKKDLHEMIEFAIEFAVVGTILLVPIFLLFSLIALVFIIVGGIH